jgi:two-component system sensor histidine kinase AlgZ
MAKSITQEEHFLPNLSSFAIAIRILLMALMIAIIITIARNSSLDAQSWQELSLMAMFVTVITLLGLILLRLVSPYINRLEPLWESVAILLVLLAAIAIGIELLVFGLYQLKVVPTRWPDWHLSVLVRSLLIGAIIGGFGLRYLIFAHRAERDAKSEQESRMQALQSRIRPHFLFNSMNSIASLTRSDPARAEAALQDLADLFRVLLADARKLVPISAEREISRQYLEIEKLRLGDRLKVTWNVNNVPRSAMIPALTLQPLLENAIYHGIEPRFSGGTVKIELWGEGETLNVMITNPLPEVRKQDHHRGNKIAMDNIRQRLASHFGAAATMQSFEEAEHFHVKVKLPIVRG